MKIASSMASAVVEGRSDGSGQGMEDEEWKEDGATSAADVAAIAGMDTGDML